MALTQVSRGLLSTSIDDNGNATAITIDSNENVGIGNSVMSSMFSTAQNLVVGTGSGNNGITVYSQSNAVGDIAFADGTTDPAHYSGLIRYDHSLDAMRLFTSSAERMRIDSSGNLLVGTTDNQPFNNTSGTGFAVAHDGYFSVTRNGAVAYFNRNTSDGDIIDFRKDGSTIGSVLSYGASRLAIGSGDVGLVFAGDFDSLYPSDGGVNSRASAIDLGLASVRFDDVFCVSVNQSSDRNLKQDIEELSEAEQRVAVTAKGLLRKYRLVSSVLEKGDDARIHFGIIAQDLQAAFEAEGLDPSRYAMWCSDTWTDEDTGEEVTCQSIRYTQLLAFIIAAI